VPDTYSPRSPPGFKQPQAKNAEKAKESVSKLFPNEVWDEEAEHVFVAKSRFREKGVFEKEMVQAKILANIGSTVYLLPEIQKENGEKSADAVVDGLLMEFKTITGGIKKVERRFRESRLQCKNSFLKIDNSKLSKETVQSKIQTILLSTDYFGGTDGLLVIHITETDSTYYWKLSDLVKKNPDQ
jgi:hypothetical protein